MDGNRTGWIWRRCAHHGDLFREYAHGQCDLCLSNTHTSALAVFLRIYRSWLYNYTVYTYMVLHMMDRSSILRVENMALEGPLQKA
jgi:hypothetical protein